MEAEVKKCRIKFCRKRVPKSNHSDKCPRHATQDFKEKHPLEYAFNKLRSRAKERGISFSLTFAQYTAFAIMTGYGEGKGVTADSLTIDRIDNSRGYESGNIRALTKSANASKLNRLAYANLPAYLREEMKQALATPPPTLLTRFRFSNRE